MRRLKLALVRRVEAILNWIAPSRSMFVRALVPRISLAELRAHALTGSGPRSWLEGRFVRWMEAGWLVAQTGRAGGLRLSMRFLPLSHSQIGAIAFGDLESHVQEAMVRHLVPGGVLYDIGGNIGFFSLLGAHLIGPEPGHVYAFEPAPENAQAIAVNAARNAFENITVIAKAVGAGAGRVRLQLVEDAAWSKLEDYGAHPLTEQVIEVDQVAIDDLLAAGEIRPPTVVKIDVEGAELAVLEGMRRTIAEHRPAIICELHGTNREFVAAMDGLGYRVINLDGAGPLDEPGSGNYALGLPPQDQGE